MGLRLIRKIFKQEGELAYKYTKREKARHTSMVSSITVSVALFLIVNGVIINFLQYHSKLTYDDYLIEGTTVEAAEQVVEHLEKNELMNDYFIQTEAFQNFYDLNIEVPKDKISDTMLEILKQDRSSIVTSTSTSENLNGYANTQSFIFLPYYFKEKAYTEILKRAGISELKENECILLNSQQVESSTYGEKFEITKYEIRR